MVELKDKIILAVKTVIANEASVETEDGETIGLYLESNNVDHIAQQVADDLSAEENRIRRDTVRKVVNKIGAVAHEMQITARILYQGKNQSQAQRAYGEQCAAQKIMEELTKLAAEYGAEVEE